VGVSADSGVPDQPMGDEETKQGAKNRAEAALAAVPNASFAAGLEGGLSKFDAAHAEANGGRSGMEVFAWMAVTGRTPSKPTTSAANPELPQQSSWGFAKTASFELPSVVAELIVHKGMELGDADDVIFERTNSKQGSGVVGILSNGLIDRTEYYTQPMILALIPFMNPTLY
jgi:non-canonical (house-cleaning) NTP pyrophosphatase